MGLRFYVLPLQKTRSKIYSRNTENCAEICAVFRVSFIEDNFSSTEPCLFTLTNAACILQRPYPCSRSNTGAADSVPFARLPVKSCIAQPGNTQSGARAQELAWRQGVPYISIILLLKLLRRFTLATDYEKECDKEKLPIDRKMVLTIREAAEYCNIAAD